MNLRDFASDIIGAGSGSLPEATLAEIALVGEADQGVKCSMSGKPIEISLAGAREFYDPEHATCQGCSRCQII